MNLFVLDADPVVAARYHCDKHVGKMLMEACQLMATAKASHGARQPEEPKPTHWSHPAARWARLSGGNYRWVLALAAELAHEHERRFGTRHSWARFVHGGSLADCPPCLLLSEGITPRPLIVRGEPVSFVPTDDAVSRYRSHYRRLPFAYWLRECSPEPSWWRQAEACRA